MTACPHTAGAVAAEMRDALRSRRGEARFEVRDPVPRSNGPGRAEEQRCRQSRVGKSDGSPAEVGDKGRILTLEGVISGSH